MRTSQIAILLCLALLFLNGCAQQPRDGMFTAALEGDETTVTIGMNSDNTYTGSWKDMRVRSDGPYGNSYNVGAQSTAQGMGLQYYMQYIIDISDLPDGADITSAKFHFNVGSSLSSEGSFFIELRSLNKPLTETGATFYKYDGTNEWTNKDGGYSDSSAPYGSSWQELYSPGWKEIGLNPAGLAYIKNALQGGGILRFMLYPTLEGAQCGSKTRKRILNMSEFTDGMRPYFEVAYTTAPCTDGTTRQCGTTDEGECEYGTQICNNGQWGDCGGTYKGPVDETCNNKDDDCDGSTDEGLNIACSSNSNCSGGTCINAGKCDSYCSGGGECAQGQQQGCGTNAGECVSGTQTCVDGQWGTCGGTYQGPQSEICGNDADEDCDGKLNNGCPEICGDEIDNDGDGFIDEGCGTGEYAPHPRIWINTDPDYPGYARLQKLKAKKDQDTWDWQYFANCPNHNTCGFEMYVKNALLYQVTGEANYCEKAMDLWYGGHGGLVPGTVTSATETTLTDSTKNWSIGANAKYVNIYRDGEVWQTRKIKSASGDTMVIADAWTDIPPEGTTYKVFNKINFNFNVYGNDCRDTALLYDWCWDRLSDEAKQDMIVYISKPKMENNRTYFNALYKDIKGFVWGYAIAGDNYIIDGYDGNAEEWIYWGNDKYQWSLQTYIPPYGGMQGGAQYAGEGYGDAGNSYYGGQYMLGRTTATGEDLFSMFDSPLFGNFWRNKQNYVLYLITQMSRGWWDYARTGLNAYQNYSGQIAASLMQVNDIPGYANCHVQAEINKWVSTAKTKISATEWFLWYNSEITECPLDSMDLYYSTAGEYFKNGYWTEGPGKNYWRSDWGFTPRTYVFFGAGDNAPLTQGFRNEHGAVQVFHNGEKLLLKETGWSSDAYREGSVYASTLTVFNPEQTGIKFECKGNLESSTQVNYGGQSNPCTFDRGATNKGETNEYLKSYLDRAAYLHMEDAAGYDYIEADFTNAYANLSWPDKYGGLYDGWFKPQLTAESGAIRAVAYLRAGAQGGAGGQGNADEFIVIRDIVNALDASFTTKAIFRFNEKPEVSGNLVTDNSTQDKGLYVPGFVEAYNGDTITETVGNSKLFIKNLSGEGIIRMAGGCDGNVYTTGGGQGSSAAGANFWA